MMSTFSSCPIPSIHSLRLIPKNFILSKFHPISCPTRKASFNYCYPSTSFSSFTIYKERFDNGGLNLRACSTSQPFIGRVGSQRRERNASFLSFGNDQSIGLTEKNNDLSQILSAMLPFVVAATAIAALAQPSTFTWWVGVICFDYFFTILF